MGGYSEVWNQVRFSNNDIWIQPVIINKFLTDHTYLVSSSNHFSNNNNTGWHNIFEKIYCPTKKSCCVRPDHKWRRAPAASSVCTKIPVRDDFRFFWLLIIYGQHQLVYNTAGALPTESQCWRNYRNVMDSIYNYLNVSKWEMVEFWKAGPSKLFAIVVHERA